VWRPSHNLAEVVRRRGRALEGMGVQQGPALWLLPEEAVFLVERGSLVLLGEGADLPPDDALPSHRMLSRQGARALLTPAGISPCHYLTYADMMRAGLLGRRARSVWTAARDAAPPADPERAPPGEAAAEPGPAKPRPVKERVHVAFKFTKRGALRVVVAVVGGPNAGSKRKRAAVSPFPDGKGLDMLTLASAPPPGSADHVKVAFDGWDKGSARPDSHRRMQGQGSVAPSCRVAVWPSQCGPGGGGAIGTGIVRPGGAPGRARLPPDARQLLELQAAGGPPVTNAAVAHGVVAYLSYRIVEPEGAAVKKDEREGDAGTRDATEEMPPADGGGDGLAEGDTAQDLDRGDDGAFAMDVGE